MARNKLTQPFSTSLPGFSLIELVIVISLIGILMTAASTLFFATLVGNSKSSVIQTVKEEGDFALSQMEFLIRNAITIEPNLADQLCIADMESISFKAYDNGVTTLFLEEDTDGKFKIASGSGVYLTSGTVDVIDGPTFDCAQSTDQRSTFVEVTFTLQKGTPGVDQATEIVRQTFNTKVNFRTL